jgi:thiosulfate reductase cytochrome b subunit
VNRIYLHPLPLRIWHWTNAALVAVLLVTAIQIRIPGLASLRPQDPALLVHKYAGWAMVLSWIFWAAYSLLSGNLRRHYLLRKKDFGGIFNQAEFYLVSIFKGGENPFRPTPEEKFNPLQKLAYGAVM